MLGTAHVVGSVLGDEVPLDQQESVLPLTSTMAVLPVWSVLGIAVTLS